MARTDPDVVLRYGLGYLDKLALAGDGCARTTRTNLRIMVIFLKALASYCIYLLKKHLHLAFDFALFIYFFKSTSMSMC